MRLRATESKKETISLLSLEIRRIKESIPSVLIEE